MFDIPHDQLSRNKQLKESNVGLNRGTIKRQWGYYKVLHKGDGYTVKELTILPGKSLSDQRHFKRDEHWFVVKGTLMMDLQSEQFSGKMYKIMLTVNPNDNTHQLCDWTIARETWHRPYNEGTDNVVVIETWTGESSESDIERRNQ